jgi:hypothetical protein
VVKGLARATLATALALAACELLLRLTGLGPWTPFGTFDDIPRMGAPDAELGWVNRPGEYRYNNVYGPVEVHIDAGGARAPTPADGTEVALYGGSFAFGFGLSDAEQLGAQLGALRPDLAVHNRAVPGYGTLQSLLLHERQPQSSDVVIYGLVELHEARNVAAWSWLRALDRTAGDHAWAAAPSAWWDGAALSYAPPRAYHHWPASERVALIDLVERTVIAVHDRPLGGKSETTVQLMVRFSSDVEARGGRFVVALLDAPTRADFYLRRLREERIEVVDLRHPQLPAWSIPGDGHPDARVHAEWARQLAEVL